MAVASLLTLAAAALLVWSPGRRAHAQQDRQLVQTGSANANTSKRIALVIGNGAYTTAPLLKNPPNDARDMAATLRALGFDVTSGINANQRDMKRLIREFGQKLKTGGSGLFYYAGHGVQSKGRNYLIPVDADIASEAEVEDSGVDASLVLNYMDDAQNGLNIVILDACRNNPFSRSFRSASDGLAQVDAPTGTLIAYATAPGRVASDGTGQNGLYTSELLKQMRVPGLSATEMFMRVRAEVMKQTANKQVPWEASSLVGSYYFSGGPSSTASNNAATSETKFDAAAFEYSYWETIKNSTSADDFKAYLEKYPEGQFAGLAKNRIARLQPTTKPAERSSPSSGGQAELTFWDSIKNSTSPDDFRAYLEKYPNGEFVVLAKNRLAPLESAEKEKAKADEIARNTKSFKGRYGRWGAGLTYNHPGTLIVTPRNVRFVYDDVEENKSSFDNQTYKPVVLECSALDAARLDDIFIREISDGVDKMRFQAESAGDATSALNAARAACRAAPLGAAVAKEGSLEGTTWKGDSSGGDKHYEFQFLPNGEVVWRLGWGRLSNPTYKGTWSQAGNTIHMDFPQGESIGTSPVEATISGNKMTGSWNFGRSGVRWDKGMYKFTIEKAATTEASDVSKIAVVDKPPLSDIAGTWNTMDGHGQMVFMADGTCTWIYNKGPHNEGTWAFTNTSHTVVKFSINTGPSVVLRLSADGKRLEGTDSSGKSMIFTR